MKRVGRVICWIPRILSIIFIIFLAIFSLDVFDEHLGFWGTALALFMHNLPSIILLIITIIAWKRELVGAIAFALGGMLFLVLTIIRTVLSSPIHWSMLVGILMISVPAFLIAYLYYLNWKNKKIRTFKKQ